MALLDLSPLLIDPDLVDKFNVARIDIFRRGMRGLFGNEMVPYMYLGFDGKNWSEWSV